MSVPAAPPDEARAAIEGARRDYDRERVAVMRHAQMCGWCLDGPCPMGRAVRENAEAYRRHLDALTGGAHRPPTADDQTATPATGA